MLSSEERLKIIKEIEEKLFYLHFDLKLRVSGIKSESEIDPKDESFGRNLGMACLALEKMSENV